MSHIGTSVEQLTDFLQTVEAARNQQFSAELRSVEIADNHTSAGSNWRYMVVSEAAVVANRINFLACHPRLPGFLGGSAIKVASEGDPRSRIITEPMFATEAELLGDYPVRSYFQFAATVTRHTQRLSRLLIINTVEECDSSTKHSKPLYDLTVYPSVYGFSGDIKGETFQRYKRTMQRTIRSDYVKENPWAEDWHVFSDGGIWKVFADGLDEFSDTAYEQKQRLQDELIPKLDPGRNWDYPDELYHFPLGLLRAASRELGVTSS